MPSIPPLYTLDTQLYPLYSTSTPPLYSLWTPSTSLYIFSILHSSSSLPPLYRLCTPLNTLYTHSLLPVCSLNDPPHTLYIPSISPLYTPYTPCLPLYTTHNQVTASRNEGQTARNRQRDSAGGGQEQGEGETGGHCTYSILGLLVGPGVQQQPHTAIMAVISGPNKGSVILYT